MLIVSGSENTIPVELLPQHVTVIRFCPLYGLSTETIIQALFYLCQLHFKLIRVRLFIKEKSTALKRQVLKTNKGFNVNNG